MFGLDVCRTIWLVRFVGANKTAIFATKEGKFIGPNIITGAKYHVSSVRNTAVYDSIQPSLASHDASYVTPSPIFSQGYTSPFGSSSIPAPSLAPVKLNLPRSAKKNLRKTIIVVSLIRRDGRNQPCSSKTASLDYNVITHIVVNLDQSACSVGNVAHLVKQQLGVDVILLDSKCFRLYDNDSTSGIGFWKSTRKILAASKLLEKMVKHLTIILYFVIN